MTFWIVLRWDGHFPTRFMCTGTSRHEIEVCATSDERTRAARAVKILQISQKFHEIWGDLAETPKRNLGDFKRNSGPPQAKIADASEASFTCGIKVWVSKRIGCAATLSGVVCRRRL